MNKFFAAACLLAVFTMPARAEKINLVADDRVEVDGDAVSAPPALAGLLGLFSGVSPLLCREVCFRALGVNLSAITDAAGTSPPYMP